MKYKVYIDGQEGTTGLKIVERLINRSDIELIRIDEALRKDTGERKRLINQSDFTFLCLPDQAAIEAVTLAENDNVRIIDASTAHRTNADWVYGLPELSLKQRADIAASKRVAVPGCYASGFASVAYPLIQRGIISPDYPVTCHAVSGYSGAGKKAIAVYEGDRPQEYNSPRQYALTQEHKHLKEMQAISGLTYKPVFNPIVDNYFCGMVVSVPLLPRMMDKALSLTQLHEAYKDYYENCHFIKVMPINGEGAMSEAGFIAANTLADTNMLEIFVCGNDERMTVTARLDNLGKGASGAAVQCMNIMMGTDEKTGLC